MSKILRISILLLLIFSCKPDRKVNIHPEQEVHVVSVKKFEVAEKNKITVYNCVADPSISYHIYVPGAYDTLKTFPVIFFADPHADGMLPLEKKI